MRRTTQGLDLKQRCVRIACCQSSRSSAGRTRGRPSAALMRATPSRWRGARTRARCGGVRCVPSRQTGFRLQRQVPFCPDGRRRVAPTYSLRRCRSGAWLHLTQEAGSAGAARSVLHWALGVRRPAGRAGGALVSSVAGGVPFRTINEPVKHPIHIRLSPHPTDLLQQARSRTPLCHCRHPGQEDPITAAG